MLKRNFHVNSALFITIPFLLALTLLIPAGAAEYEANEWFRKWNCLGPFPSSDVSDIDRNPFPGGAPEYVLPFSEALVAKTLESSPTLKRAKAAPREGGFVDLRKRFGEKLDDVMAYAWIEFEAPRTGSAVLSVGSDDWIKVWLNGRVVHSNPVFRGSAPDQEQLLVPLRQGKNTCVVKLGQGWGDWGFYLRFSEIYDRTKQARLVVMNEPEPPLILTGAPFSFQQHLYLSLINVGREPARELSLEARSNALQPVPSLPFSCQPGEVAQCRVTLKAAQNLKSGESVSIDVVSSGEKDGGEKLASVTTQSAKAYPFFRKPSGGDGGSVTIVQLTDPHIVDFDTVLFEVKTAERLKKAVAEINALKPPPDFVVVTGDVLLDKHPGFAVFKEIIDELEIPYLLCFGNHDKPLGPASAHRVFSEWGFPPYYAFDYKGRSYFILDSVAEANPNSGELIPEQLEWLDDAMKSEAAEPRVFFLHHDLFTSHGTKNKDAVQEILRKYPGEKWFFTGHWHCDCFVKSGDQRHVVSTATGYLFGGDADRFKHDKALPGYRIIELKNGELKSWLKPLGRKRIPDPPLKDYYSVEEIEKIMSPENYDE